MYYTIWIDESRSFITDSMVSLQRMQQDHPPTALVIFQADRIVLSVLNS